VSDKKVKMADYEVFSTTADVGIRVRGKDYKELYQNALKGFNALIFGRPLPDTLASAPTRYPFAYTGDSGENVLVNLLSEVMFLLYTREKLTVAVEFKEAAEKQLNAHLLTAALPPGLEAEMEIKSVTYHNLHISEENGIKSVEIVFDI
jgi:SHS2 domain-containing protein